MRTCILHFGMAKTGSTSIQATLGELPEMPDFRYLKVKEANIGRSLAFAFMDDPNEFRPVRKLALDARKLKRRKRRTLAELESQCGGTESLVLASSEMLSLFDTDSLVALRDWLQARFDVVRLIGYVREPAGFIESMLQQSLKNGSDGFDAARRYPSYRERFEKFEQVFGADRVQYRLFAPRDFPGQCVVRDFLGAIGLTLPESQIKRINEGLSREAVGLLYAYRQVHSTLADGRAALRRNRRLITLLSELKGDKLRIAPALLRQVIESQADDMAWIAERLGHPLVPSYHGPEVAVVQEVGDLLVFSPACLQWLSQRSGLPLGEQHQRPTELGELVAALDRCLELLEADADGEEGGDDDDDTPAAAAPPATPALALPPVAPAAAAQGQRLELADLVAALRRRCPELGADDRQLSLLVEQALAGLKAELGAHADGLEVSGLGRFKPRRNAAGAAEGRLHFRPAVVAGEGAA